MAGLITLAQSLTRVDSWKSILGSFGSRQDKGRTNNYVLCPNYTLDDYTLSAAYKDLWLVRRVVEGMAQDALRCGWGVDENEKLQKFSALNVATHEEGAFERALYMAALKGGAGLFIGYKNSGMNPQNLLEPAPAGAEVAFLEVFDRFQLTGEARVREVDSPEYDRPQVWQVTGTRRAGLRFHASRMIRFPGIPRARTDQAETQEERDWGYSMLQPVWEDIVRYGVYWQAVGHLMSVSSVGVLKLKGIIEMLASKRQSVVESRIDLMNETLSLTRNLILDPVGGEEYHREAVSFAEIPALLQELSVSIAAALGRPVTKLFGRAPAGLNATGDADMRNYYDEVQSYRERMIEPRLEQILEICEGRKIDVKFESLWQPTDKERAEIRNLNTTGTEAGWRMGIWSNDEIRKAANDGKLPEEMGYPDKAPPPEKAPGLLPPGGSDPEGGDDEGGLEDDPVYQARGMLDRSDASDLDPEVKAARVTLAKAVARAMDLSAATRAAREAYEEYEASVDDASGSSKRLAAIEEHPSYIAAKATAEPFDPDDESVQARLARHKLEKAEAAADSAIEKQRRDLKAVAIKAERAERKAEFALQSGLDDVEEAHHKQLTRAYDELSAATDAYEAIPFFEEGNDLDTAQRLANLKAKKHGPAAYARLQAAQAAAKDAQEDFDEFMALSRGKGVPFKVEGAAARAKLIQEGSRGGRYYRSESGGKVYVKGDS